MVGPTTNGMVVLPPSADDTGWARLATREVPKADGKEHGPMGRRSSRRVREAGRGSHNPPKVWEEMYGGSKEGVETEAFWECGARAPASGGHTGH